MDFFSNLSEPPYGKRFPEMRRSAPDHFKGALVMGKYVLGWFLGVPVIVLVIVYMLFH
jgi:hypothetical protein